MLAESPITSYDEDILRNLVQKQNRAFYERDKVLAEQADYLQFSDTLKKLQNELEKDLPMKVMMDIGCNFYTEAVVGDRKHVVVNMGKGIFVEMSLTEAARFVSRKLSLLKAVESLLSDEIAAAKAAYKLILGLKTVANIS